MTKKERRSFLFSRQQLSFMLDVDRKTVSKHLANTVPDDNSGTYPKWQVVTAVKALLPYLNQRYADGIADRVDPNKLAPKDRADHYQAELRRIEYERETRELIPVEEVRAAFAGALKALATGLDTAPDVLQREAHLTDHQYERLTQSFDEMRELLYRALCEFECSDQPDE